MSRSYDVGQTVAASFQAPTLFMIAQDLTKMQVLTNIDEADVGRVKVGQVASFSVDAFPEQSFKGSVAQIRLSPQTVQNVVTYPVMLDVPNQDLKLKPGMTANVQIPVDVRHDVLRAPNAALRFRPDPADVVGGDKGKSGAPATASAAPSTGAPRPERGTADGRAPGRRPGDRRPRTGRPRRARRAGGGGRGGFSGGAGGGRPAASRTGTLYVEIPDGKGKLKAVTVRTLLTDGNMTAIESKDLKEGDEIIVGLATARAGAAAAGGAGGPGGGGRRPF